MMMLLWRIIALLLITSGRTNACPSLCTCPSWSTVVCNGGTVASVMASLPSTTTSITIQNTNANTLSQTDFDTVNIPNLWYFKLTNSLAQTIKDNTFGKFSQMRNLNLTSNQLRNIEKDAFNGLGILQELDLRNNEIQNIGEIFLPLRSLKRLYLQANRIITIPSGSFLSQSNLMSLILDQNEIQSYDSLTFQGLTSLSYLSLRKCELNAISNDLLGALHAIKTLDLGNNAIFTLPRAEDWRRNAPSLSVLILDHNQITELKSQQFLGMTLRKLDLSFNRLSRISVDNFGQCNIDDLDLSDNSIIQVASRAFASMGPRLRTMSMARNSILSLPEDAFYGLYLLQSLNLSSCSITKLHPGQFHNLNQLHFLDLSGNKLNNVPNGILQSFQFIHRLYLEGNQWKCDCNIISFNRPLAGIILDIAEKWGLQNAEDFSLQFSDQNRQQYITERNRKDIQNGNVLTLTSSPAKTAQNLYTKLKEGKADERLDALKMLSNLAGDSTFAIEFITKDGLKIIKQFVIDGKHHGEPLSYILKSFVALMEHSVVSWDTIEPEFTKKVCDCVLSQKTGVSCQLPSLEILESVILHSTQLSKHSAIESNISPEKIHPHLQNPDLQKNSLALLNALFMKAAPEKKKKIGDSIHARGFRNTIMTAAVEEWAFMWNHADNITATSVLSGSRSVGTEMGHQLYCLQTLMLNMHETKMNSPVNPHDTSVQKQIESLRNTAFDLDTEANQPGSRKSNLYRKLGFQDQSNPAQDFVNNTPPGALALDNIHYFALKHQENYVKVVLENSSRADEHDCPFIQASIMLTKTLCEILNIGQPPQDDGNTFYPMFFSHDKPFEEFFCICIQLLNKTWREMRASTEDFHKVLGVVKEQINRALDIQPTSFEAFRLRLNQLTYADIMKLWDQERKNKEEWESQAQPIVELRDMIRPDIMKLIKQQRLNYLMEGARFAKYNPKGRTKDRSWYWRLSPNHKAFHFSECGENDKPSLDQLNNKLQVSEIKSLLVGKDCPHVREKNKAKSNYNSGLAFAIQPNTDNAECYCFIAKDEKEFDMWTDGINVLLSNEMTSNQMNQDLEMLLSMEIKIRLLDTEGITIPKEPPPIPPEPDNYDFAYQVL
ncbi:hypothetical protein FSP39_024837 [Pinctada imbricata]|uniref:ELMO domain-containing protein n=1 Tax=Pinctada imbricata TaxID=66713 RepID=A0AA89BTL9_PINIB|nr:hypothetical protein FSP39_024837 [Pinctada imbricata]